MRTTVGAEEAVTLASVGSALTGSANVDETFASRATSQPGRVPVPGRRVVALAASSALSTSRCSVCASIPDAASFGRRVVGHLGDRLVELGSQFGRLLLLLGPVCSLDDGGPPVLAQHRIELQRRVGVDQPRQFLGQLLASSAS